MAFLLPVKEAGLLPDWLTEIPEEAEVQKLPDHAFADVSNRRMPIHNKSAAWLSAVSSFVYGTPVGHWADRLKSACHAYRITDQVKQVIDLLRPEETYHTEKEAQSEKAYALVLGSGETRKCLYPVNSSFEVEKSARELSGAIKEKKIPEAWLLLASREILKSAAARSVPDERIPDNVRLLGTERVSSPEYLEAQVEKRKAAGIPEGSEKVYLKLARQVLDNELPIEDGVLGWELADRYFGIEGKVASPATAFNSGIRRTDLEKLAAQVVWLDDLQIPHAALQTVPMEKVAMALPKEDAAVILKAAASDGRTATRLLRDICPESMNVLLRFIHDHAA